MKLARVEEVEQSRMDVFLKNNDSINREHLLRNGYVAEVNGEIIGCFSLEWIDRDVYWLKQLYISQSEANTLLSLIEAILMLAKYEHAKEVRVNSKQPMTDIILEAMQFQVKDRNEKRDGKWWSYSVS